MVSGKLASHRSLKMEIVLVAVSEDGVDWGFHGRRGNLRSLQAAFTAHFLMPELNLLKPEESKGQCWEPTC